MFDSLKSIFSKSEISDSVLVENIKVDMHSHLLPGIDDGVKSIEESIEIIRHFIGLGYKKIITTPHIMKGTYDNTSEIIKNKLQIVRQEVQSQNLDIEIEASAEYYLDTHFLDLLFNGDILSFGKENYVLVEFSYLQKQNDYQNIFMNISQTDYQPILAHPERYAYFYDKNLSQLKQIKEQGVLFQLNLFSILGVYGKGAKMVAEHLVKENMIDFVGTDIHKPKHIAYLDDCLKDKYLQKLLQSGNLKNKSLLS